MQNAPLHHSNGAAGHCPMGLATSDEWGCFTLFYSLRKLDATRFQVLDLDKREIAC